MRESTPVERQIVKELDDYCKKLYEPEFRRHLGISAIGDDCARKLWMDFRWITKPHFASIDGEDDTGRLVRLFNRGHVAEPRLIEWLIGAGAQVWAFNPESATEEQFRVEGVNGHFGGSLDAIIRWTLISNVHGLAEFKTYNDKRFKKLEEDGVRLADSKYWAQFITYAVKYGLPYVLFLAINKNDDRIYPEIIWIDDAIRAEVDDIERKADYIIRSQQPPPRISNLPAYFKCRMCLHVGACHLDKPVEVNCRSCQHATPIVDPAYPKQWGCTKFNCILTDETIATGCQHHSPII